MGFFLKPRPVEADLRGQRQNPVGSGRRCGEGQFLEPWNCGNATPEAHHRSAAFLMKKQFRRGTTVSNTAQCQADGLDVGSWSLCSIRVCYGLHLDPFGVPHLPVPQIRIGSVSSLQAAGGTGREVQALVSNQIRWWQSQTPLLLGALWGSVSQPDTLLTALSPQRGPREGRQGPAGASRRFIVLLVALTGAWE